VVVVFDLESRTRAMLHRRSRQPIGAIDARKRAASLASLTAAEPSTATTNRPAHTGGVVEAESE